MGFVTLKLSVPRCTVGGPLYFWMCIRCAAEQKLLCLSLTHSPLKPLFIILRQLLHAVEFRLGAGWAGREGREGRVA